MVDLTSCAGSLHHETIVHRILTLSRPDFDSPSVFCRMLDKTKGGHFTISPKKGLHLTTKQNYLPSSNVLQTRFLNDEGVLNVIDFFPRPKADSASKASVAELVTAKVPRAVEGLFDDPKRWLVRRVECIRGEIDVDVEVLPVSPPSLIYLFFSCNVSLTLSRRSTMHATSIVQK